MRPSAPVRAIALALAFAAPAHAAALRIALPPSASGSASPLPALLRAAATGLHLKIALVALAKTPMTTAWDIALLDPLALDQACTAGAVAKLDWTQFGGRGRFLPIATTDCGLGAAISSTLLTWDPKKLPVAPSWGDFWNVARLPGRRGLARSPIGTLEIALLADGVAPGDIYGTLARKDGVARAFRKLDQLRPYIAWWQNDSDPVALVAAGGALMSSAPSDQVIAAGRRLRRSFGLQWTGAIASVQSWAIRATARNPTGAAALINALETPSAVAQLAQAGLGAALPPDPHAPPETSPATHLNQALTLDTGFWRDHQAPLSRQFNDWLKH